MQISFLGAQLHGEVDQLLHQMHGTHLPFSLLKLMVLPALLLTLWAGLVHLGLVPARRLVTQIDC